MTRENFLQNHWMPYPPFPAHARAWGRIVGLDRRARAMTLHRGDQVTPVTVAFDIDVLELNDLVAILPDRFVLLAPARREPALRRFDTATLAAWSAFLRDVRAFFIERGFLETPTPGLVPCPGTEPSLDVFSTEMMRGSHRQTYFLPTSPELHLKKLLAMGIEKPFEIKTCYRNGEITRQHQPEFTMIEWYRAWEGPSALREDVIALVERLAADSPEKRRPRAIRRAKMRDLFLEKLGAHLRPEDGLERYLAIARAAGLEPRPSSSIDDVFFLIFTERIETTFDADELVIVEDWPPFQAALARLTPEGWGDRFEVYWRGLELANAFHELNDPIAQRRRFEEDLAKKAALGKEPIPLDEDFLAALEAGLPPSAGIALGLERLFMALNDETDIARLRAFPYR